MASNQETWLDQRAVVTETIQPNQPGRVYFHATSWPAICEQAATLIPGEIAQVTGRHNITLVVRQVCK
jgi:membrane protein implicated in regulation of membrane protease activity